MMLVEVVDGAVVLRKGFLKKYGVKG